MVGLKTYYYDMEEFLKEMREFAQRQNKSPGTIVQYVTGLSGTAWSKWVSGKSTPRYDTVLALRKYMQENASPNEEAAQ